MIYQSAKTAEGTIKNTVQSYVEIKRMESLAMSIQILAYFVANQTLRQELVELAGQPITVL
jgi:hypothetical protein